MCWLVCRNARNLKGSSPARFSAAVARSVLYAKTFTLVNSEEKEFAPRVLITNFFALIQIHPFLDDASEFVAVVATFSPFGDSCPARSKPIGWAEGGERTRWKLRRLDARGNGGQRDRR